MPFFKKTSDKIKKLKNFDFSKINSPPAKDNYILAKVLDVYDGDTITVGYFSNKSSKSAFKIKVRLIGIDTPEIRTKNNYEKEAAQFVKKYVENLISNKIIHLKIIKWDKFGGRVNGYVKYMSTETNILKDLSSDLLEKNYAKFYNGTTKKEKWTNSEYKRIYS